MLELWLKNGLNWNLLSTDERIATVVGALALPIVFVALPYAVWSGRVRTFGLRALERRFDGIRLHNVAEAGDVSFVYHVYRGFLVWVTQTEVRVTAPREDAVILLRRLLHYNLTWGMLSRGVLFVPFLAIANYNIQLHSIKRQVERP